MGRYSDNIPELTPCQWAMKQHRRALKSIRLFTSEPEPCKSGRSIYSVRCIDRGLIFPGGTDDVAAWLGNDVNRKSLSVAIANRRPYRGHLFEFIRPNRVQ